MVKFLTTIAVLVASTTIAQASFQCSVSAENPRNPGTYDQLLAVFQDELPADNGVIFYSSGAQAVSAMKSVNGILQLASFDQDTKKVNAIAAAKTESLFLIDGINKWSISCQKK